MALFILEVDTIERTMSYPVVRHQFIGRTREEAEQYYAAHMKTDTFLQACAIVGEWNGIPCRVTKRWRIA